MKISSPGSSGYPLVDEFCRLVVPTNTCPILLNDALIVTPFCNVLALSGFPLPVTDMVSTNMVEGGTTWFTLVFTNFSVPTVVTESATELKDVFAVSTFPLTVVTVEFRVAILLSTLVTDVAVFSVLVATVPTTVTSSVADRLRMSRSVAMSQQARSQSRRTS